MRLGKAIEGRCQLGSLGLGVSLSVSLGVGVAIGVGIGVGAAVGARRCQHEYPVAAAERGREGGERCGRRLPQHVMTWAEVEGDLLVHRPAAAAVEDEQRLLLPGRGE